MSPFVLVALVTAGELFSAMSAKVTFQPDVDVRAVSFGSSKRLSADMALERVDAGVDGLAVDQHAAASRKNFLAIRAGSVCQVIVRSDPDAGGV